MDFNQYQIACLGTFVRNKKHSKLLGILRMSLGICGEAGEIAEKFKKLLRDSDDELIIDEKFKKEIGKEIGDVLWYLAMLCSLIGLNFNQIARQNIEKLLDRKKRGKIQGEGDNR